jgi:hypothetical protein
MRLHDVDHPCANAWPNFCASMRAMRATTKRRARTVGFALACALTAACGDDGTDGLSSCPGGRIELDQNDVFGCAPMSRPAAAGAKSTAVAGAKSATSSQASTGTQAAGAPVSAGASNGGGAGAPPAANSGSAPASQASNPPPASGGAAAAMSSSGKALAVPNGPWSCTQVNDVCSCVPAEGLGDGCTKPHPTCCTFVTMNDKIVACVCAPEGSAQCTGMKADSAGYPSVAKCPP